MSTTDRLAEERVFELTHEELDALPYGVITLDREGRILRYNYAEAKFARRTTAGTIGLGFFTDVAPCTNVQAFKGRFDEFARSRDSGVEKFDFTFSFRWGHQDVSITLLRKVEHDDINLIVQGRTQAALDIAPAAQAALEGATPLATDGGGAPILGLGARELPAATAWKRGSAEERAWRARIHPDDAAPVHAILETARVQHRAYALQYRLLAADAAERVIQEYGSFAVGDPSYAALIDVTEHTRQEIELRHLAHYDELTGLPNRGLFLERIAAAANEVRDNGHVAAVLLFSLTGIESVNATFGRACGDEVLRQVGLRLGESVRGGDSVARITNHTFGVLLTDVDKVESVATLGRRILESLYGPFNVGPRTHHLAARLGISLTPRNGPDAAALLQAAETAMAAASRKEARSRIAWFSSGMSAIVQSDLHTEEALRVALERKEFVLHYQPIVDIETNRIAAVEALIRWNHPTRGLVMPGEFIEVAEQSGLVGALGDWALGEAARQARLWHDLGFELRVCINVSTVRFRQPAFIDLLKSVLAETGIPPRMLEIEVTESVMVQGFADVIETLAKLKQTGVRLSIDDFGTGYSSLSYLKYFPVDNLKLDRAFVADIVSDSFDRAIAKTVLTLAAELSMDCIAEGVETKEQLELLRGFGCRLIQGYYFRSPSRRPRSPINSGDPPLSDAYHRSSVSLPVALGDESRRLFVVGPGRARQRHAAGLPLLAGEDRPRLVARALRRRGFQRSGGDRAVPRRDPGGRHADRLAVDERRHGRAHRRAAAPRWSARANSTTSSSSGTTSPIRACRRLMFKTLGFEFDMNKSNPMREISMAIKRYPGPREEREDRRVLGSAPRLPRDAKDGRRGAR